MPINTAALVDSHCHPHFPPLADCLGDVLADMHRYNVGAALAVATTTQDVAAIRQLCSDYPETFFAAYGIHPITDEEVDTETLMQWGKEALAIGETGLDYAHHTIDEKTQIERFIRHIDAAKSIRKPLIIHTRNSMAATLAILERENAALVGGVLHCYTGSVAQMEKALALNFYLSFPGIITFKNAQSMRDVAALVPANRYMVETDAPYLAPTPHRGKTNTPGFVHYVAHTIARLRGCDIEQVIQETSDNFVRLFMPPA